MKAIIDFFKRLFGLEQDDSEEVKWIKSKIKDNEGKIKEVEDEKHDLDSLNDHFNE